MMESVTVTVSSAALNSAGGPRPPKTAAWSVQPPETLSPESSSDNASDNSDAFGLGVSVSVTGSTGSIGGSISPTCAQGRKRKIWDQEIIAAGTLGDGIMQVSRCNSNKNSPSPNHHHPLRSFEEALQIHQVDSNALASARSGLALAKDKECFIDALTKSRSKDQVGGGKMASWQVDDIDDHLAADFDGSLSGLGVDLTAATYNMSEALMALPPLTVFKEEAHSPTSHAASDVGAGVPRGSPVGDGNDAGAGGVHSRVVSRAEASSHSSALQQLLQQQQQHSIYTMAGITTCTSATSGVLSQSPEEGSSASESGSLHKYNPYDRLNEGHADQDDRFQYVLAAATSVACKVNEETLTYLNQGQPYEIKLKKLGELSAYRGKVVKSVLRVCFHERRLQYSEREQLMAWQQSRPGDRILEVDLPLSYGIYDVVQDPGRLNQCEFFWDPIKEVGIYIKVNCISTEFTPKKHGGEKGVPFRIQVETFMHNEGNTRRLHGGACQVKVFKLKGADRKHKQDREKIMKRPAVELQKYQPSCHCTILTDLPADAMYSGGMPVAAAVTSASGMNGSFVNSEPSVPLSSANMGHESPTGTEPESTDGRTPMPKKACYIRNEFNYPTSHVMKNGERENDLPHDEVSPRAVMPQFYLQGGLQTESNSQETAMWLQAHRFSGHQRTFANFAGADLLRLTRDDLVQICGLADGIRLFNALHCKAAEPRLTLYVCQEIEQVFHAVYLEQATYISLVSRLAPIAHVSPSQVHDVLLQGPAGIHVVITDEVVANLHNESMYCLHVISDTSSDRCRLLLKNVCR